MPDGEYLEMKFSYLSFIFFTRRASCSNLASFQQESSSLTYLCIPLYNGREQGLLFINLHQKMMNIVKGWSRRHLTHAGRMALIQITLSTLSLYHMLVLMSPCVVFF